MSSCSNLLSSTIANFILVLLVVGKLGSFEYNLQMNEKQEMGTIIFVNKRMCVECISFCTKMCHNVRKRTGRKEINNMNKIYDKVKRGYKQVNEMTEFKPQIALVLGSGLGDYAEKIKIETVIDYHEIQRISSFYSTGT